MEEEQLIGAIDIVAAFTALRQDVKTQIRSGRELQDAVADRLSDLDQRLQSMLQHMQQSTQSTPASTGKDDNTARQLAEAVAEVEEALQRALQAIPESATSSPYPALVGNFDNLLASLSWWQRLGLTGKLAGFRAELLQATQWQPPDTSSARQGLTLVLARVHRLMKQSGLERLDVLGRAFDAELMFAIDTIASSGTPSAHVAEQVRPAYTWQGKLLRHAEVRLAK